jgi:uncharacterized membrane protein YraQ (UPF0718 family)
MNKYKVLKMFGITAYFVLLALSFAFGFDPGKEIGYNFFSFSQEMVKILPCAFIIIGLFEVWVSKATVEKHLGEGSGLKGYLWAVLFAGTTIGGAYVAFPVSYTLHRKGAKLGVIFTYVGASAITRIPMTVFEASFLGVKFTLVRLFVSLPLIIITSSLLGKYLAKKGFRVQGGGDIVERSEKQAR